MDHQPITSKDFGQKRKRRTICECHREIYHILNQEEIDIERAIELVKEAYKYGIKMSLKLHEYAGREWIPEVFE
jgi:hypothetical protein